MTSRASETPVSLANGRMLAPVCFDGPTSRDTDGFMARSSVFGALTIPYIDGLTSFGTDFYRAGGSYDLNANQDLAFPVWLVRGGLTEDNNTAILLKSFGQATPTVLVQEDDPLPDGNGRFGDFENRGLTINGGKQVAFYNWARGSADLINDQQGLYWANISGVSMIARAGDPVPGYDADFEDFGGIPIVNASGQVAFSANFIGNNGYDGIFVGTEGGLSKIANIADLIPGSPDHFRHFGQYVAFNDLGQVAFTSDITPGSEESPGGDGLFLGNSSGGQLEVIFRNAQALPEGGGVFRSPSVFCLNESGELAFIASFDVNLENNSPHEGNGIWVHDGNQLCSVLKTGDEFLGSTVSALSFRGVNVGSDYFTKVKDSFNDRGELSFHYNLSNGASGLALWSSIAPHRNSSKANVLTQVEADKIRFQFVPAVEGNYVIQSSENMEDWTVINTTTTDDLGIEIPRGLKGGYFRIAPAP